MHLSLAVLWGPENLMWIALIALLLFGRKLPEVGKSLGKGIVEFKKGLQGIDDDVQQAGANKPAQDADRPALTQQNNLGHKFDPYTGKPLEQPAQPQMRFDPYTGKPLAENTTESTPSRS